MTIKRFMKERAENAALIDEVKDILLDGSPKKMSKYRKFGVETTNGFLRLLMSLGNTAFHSGDPELTGRFLGALFELAASGVLDENTLMGRTREYGLRAIHGFDYDSFAVILDGFLKYNVASLRLASARYLSGPKNERWTGIEVCVDVYLLLSIG